MTVARAKGDKGRADFLFSRIVRSRGHCQYPGCTSQGPYECAHLIGRSMSGTRVQEDNAVCLCGSHHRLIDAWWDEKQKVVQATIGEARYDELKELAREHKFLPITSAQFWKAERARLEQRAADLGIDVRRSA